MMAGTLAISSAAAHAETTSVPVSLQSLKVTQLKDRFETLRDNAEKLQVLNKGLRAAKEAEGGWTVTLDFGKNLSGWSTPFVVTGSVLRYAMSLTPNLEVSKIGRRPTNVMLVIAGVVLTSGVAVTGGSVWKLNISQGQKIEAEANIAAVQQVIEMDKQVIVKMATDLGAKVTNNVISFEGIPEGVRVFGGQGLNLNQIQTN